MATRRHFPACTKPPPRGRLDTRRGGASVSGAAPRAFVPIAGLHHARREMASGFCVFNDIGCAIETLRAVHGVHRIAYSISTRITATACTTPLPMTRN